MGKVGDHARALLRMCMTVRRSAFPVRISYRVNVRSEPMLARTDDSERLKRTDVIVSAEVGKDRFVIGALLVSSQIWTILDAVAKSGSER